METLFEHNVTQNNALTVFAVAQAVMRFEAETRREKGLGLCEALLVPPLVYHERTARAFAGKTMTQGLFYRVIAEDHELVLGLQNRLMATAERTIESVHLACSSGLLEMSTEPTFQLFGTMKALPTSVAGRNATDSVRTIFAAAKRVGYCFATTDFQSICSLLRVRF